MELSDIFGGSIGGLLAPEDQQKLTNNALLNAGLGILAASAGGARRYAGMPDRPALGQALLQGLQAGTGAYQTGAQNLLSGREYQEKMAQKKRQQELNAQLSPLLQGGDKYNAYMMAGNKAAEMGDIDTANRYFELATKFQPKEKKTAVVGNALVDESTGQAIYTAPEKPEKRNFGADRDAEAVALFGKPFEQLSPQEAKTVNKTLRDYELQAKRAGASQTNVNMGAISPFDKKVQEKSADVFLDVQNKGMIANRNIPRIEQLDKLLQSSGSGIGPVLQNYAGNLGINTKGLSDIQAASAIIKQLVPEQRQPGSGTMSDRDLAIFEQSLPRLINTPEGNKKIISTIKAIAEYDKKSGDIATSVLNGEITRQEGNKLLMSLPNPLDNIGASNIMSPQQKALQELQRRRAGRK